MARYGLPSTNTLGVSMATMQPFAKRIGTNHALARALWRTGWYEARIMSAFVGDPSQLTVEQMDAWCRDFDNWGTTDTVCFKLFDRTPHAFGKVEQWAELKDEFGKRASFALLASLALHDKGASDKAFIRCLPLVERGATDPRNFVKKGVSWALRSIGRRNIGLNSEAVKVAKRLAASSEPAAQWVGRESLRELTNPKIVKKLEARRRSSR